MTSASNLPPPAVIECDWDYGEDVEEKQDAVGHASEAHGQRLFRELFKWHGDEEQKQEGGAFEKVDQA